jgi:hypothetical protein
MAIGGANDIDRAQAELGAVRSYTPKKLTGWRRYLLPMLAGAQLGSKSADPRYPGQNLWSALGGAIGGGLSGQFHPEGPNEAWKSQAEEQAGSNLNDALAQEKARQVILNDQSTRESRDRMNDIREANQGLAQKKLENEQKEFADRQKATALGRLAGMDYEPGKDKVIDDYFAKTLGGLPEKHVKGQPMMINGELYQVPRTIGFSPTSTGIVDKSKQATMQTVTINGQKQQMWLTPKEAEQAAQAEGNRQKHQQIVNQQESGRNKRSAMRQTNNPVTPRMHGALTMLSQFRNLGTQAQRAQESAQPQTAAKLIQNQRAVGAQLKALYGDIIEWDERGQPTLVSPEGYERSTGQKASPGVVKKMNKALGIEDNE